MHHFVSNNNISIHDSIALVGFKNALIKLSLRFFLLSVVPEAAECTDGKLFKNVRTRRVGDHHGQDPGLITLRQCQERKHSYIPRILIKNGIGLINGHEDHRNQIKPIGVEWLPEWFPYAKAQAASQILHAREQVQDGVGAAWWVVFC